MRKRRSVQALATLLALGALCTSCSGGGEPGASGSTSDAIADGAPDGLDASLSDGSQGDAAKPADTTSDIPDTDDTALPDTLMPPDALVKDALADAEDAGDQDVPEEDVPEIEAKVTPEIVDTVQMDLPDKDASIPLSTHASTCTTSADCKIPCAQGSCKDGQCAYTPAPNVCVVALGNDTVGCFPPDAPHPSEPCLACKPALSQTVLSPYVWTAGYEATLEGFSVTDTSGGGVTWIADTTRAHGGKRSLYFGDPSTHTYYAGTNAAAGKAESKPLAIPQHAGLEPLLSFWLWLDTEATPGFDVLTVTATDGANTVTWTSESISGTTSGLWRRIAIGLGPLAGTEAKITFGFDTKDYKVNAYEGAYIDDVTIETGCCGGPVDCDDGNACSKDLCAGSPPMCGHDEIAACCASPADCDDGKPCTLDLCPVPGGTCSHTPKPTCCLANADCDDKDPCTLDTCPKAGEECLHQNTCCTKDSECNSGDPCLKGACANKACVYVSVCCNVDDECLDKNPCTVDFCDSGKCAHQPSSAPGCCSLQPYAESFDGGDGGFAPDVPGGDLNWTAGYTKGKAYSGTGVIYFGNAATGTVNFPSGSLTKTISGPMITLQAGAQLTLSFQYRAEINGSVSVTPSLVTATGEVKLGTLGGTGSAWKLQTYDLSSFAGDAVTLRFNISLTASQFGGGVTGAGVFIDDVFLDSTCVPKVCTASSGCGTVDPCKAGACIAGACSYPSSCCKSNDACDDGSLCTKDTCSNGKCQFSAIAGCCMGDADCNDKNACTTDLCPGPGDQCQNVAIKGCCLKNAECEDKNACTKDLCVDNVCSNQNTCCKTDAECSDGETKCTLDTCNGGTCAHKPTGASGCCTEGVLEIDFDNGDLGGVDLKNNQSKGWILYTNGKSMSQPGALYYGDPNAMNFDFGSTSGTVTLPPTAVPSGYGATFSWALYMDTEGGTYYDKFTVEIDDGAGYKVIWDKNKAGFQLETFQVWTQDISAFAGKTITVRFSFNTTDSAVNSGEGIYLDDLKIKTTCMPKNCSGPSDCDDALAFTKDSCSSGVCSYEAGTSSGCTDDFECDDKDFCTMDYCDSGKCMHEYDPWCG